MKSAILNTGEKVHLIQRRQMEKEAHRHFIGVVDAYESGVVRVTGHVYTVDTATFRFFRRPEARTRIISAASGDVLINVLPPSAAPEKGAKHAHFCSMKLPKTSADSLPKRPQRRRSGQEMPGTKVEGVLVKKGA
jgi:hypothetical protein